MSRIIMSKELYSSLEMQQDKVITKQAEVIDSLEKVIDRQKELIENLKESIKTHVLICENLKEQTYVEGK